MKSLPVTLNFKVHGNMARIIKRVDGYAVNYFEVSTEEAVIFCWHFLDALEAAGHGYPLGDQEKKKPGRAPEPPSIPHLKMVDLYVNHGWSMAGIGRVFGGLSKQRVGQIFDRLRDKGVNIPRQPIGSARDTAIAEREKRGLDGFGEPAP